MKALLLWQALKVSSVGLKKVLCDGLVESWAEAKVRFREEMNKPYKIDVRYEIHGVSVVEIKTSYYRDGLILVERSHSCDGFSYYYAWRGV